MEQLLQQSLTIVRPYLEDVDSRAVFLENHLYHLLEQDTAQRAIAFAKNYSLPLPGEAEDIFQNINRVFLQMLPTNAKNRNKCFMEQEEEIINFAAYRGEIILRKNEGQWSVLPELEFPGFDAIYRYGVLVGKYQNLVDPLWKIVTSWNLSPQVKYAGLYDTLF